VSYSKWGWVDDREKTRKADRERRPSSTPISVQCFILCRAPVSPGPPPAESSFEVIMALLANALLQVPPAPTVSLSPSTATQMRRDENTFKVYGWDQSFHIVPLFLSFTLSANPIYSIPALFIASQSMSVTFWSFYFPLTHFTLFFPPPLILNLFPRLNFITTLDLGVGIWTIQKKRSNLKSKRSNKPLFRAV